MSENKRKTWTLYQDSCQCCWLNENNGTEPIKIIEYSAYLAEKEKARELCKAAEAIINDAILFDRKDADNINHCLQLIRKYEDKND